MDTDETQMGVRGWGWTPQRGRPYRGVIHCPGLPQRVAPVRIRYSSGAGGGSGGAMRNVPDPFLHLVCA